MEKIDVVLSASSETAAGYAGLLIKELTGSITQLKAWHASFLEGHPQPLYRCQNVQRDLGGTFESLWYPSLGIANAFVYFWAFQLLCLAEIQSLLNRFPELKHAAHDDAAYSFEPSRDECLELSICIYKSMEYMLQGEFMLYGISSADFPLSIACQTFQSDAKGRAILETLDHSIITRAKIRDV
jgi:hypothetical protein